MVVIRPVTRFLVFGYHPITETLVKSHSLEEIKMDEREKCCDQFLKQIIKKLAALTFPLTMLLDEAIYIF